jgi:hypothetical protein
LFDCLRECAAGRWGLFGQNELADPEQRCWPWPEAKRLRTIALEIHSALSEFGESDPVCERFLQVCSMRGLNVPGEPKLAGASLAELECTPSPQNGTAAPLGAAAQLHEE